MVHYKVEIAEYTDLITNYPHSPDDVKTSFSEFLEDRWSEGWELISCNFDTGNTHFRCVFRANAQP